MCYKTFVSDVMYVSISSEITCFNNHATCIRNNIISICKNIIRFLYKKCYHMGHLKLYDFMRSQIHDT